MNDIQRFKTRYTVLSSGCWDWTGANGNNYGMFRYDGVLCRAHRVSYMMHKGTIPKGKFVLHKCNNKRCVNPDHLYAGNAQDNVNDSLVAGTHCSINPSGNRWQSGENHTGSKLMNEDVVCIKKMLRDKIKKSLICYIYEIGKSTLQNIACEKTWKGITI